MPDGKKGGNRINMEAAAMVSRLILPLTAALIVGWGLWQGQDIFAVFCRGAKEGLRLSIEILPTMVGLLTAVGALRGSGFLDLMGSILGQVIAFTGFPAELIPLGLMKFFSSSAATGLFLDLLQTAGPDSFSGRIASVMLGATDTVLYTMSIYLMKVGIKDGRYILKGAIFANLAGMAGAYGAVKLFFPS